MTKVILKRQELKFRLPNPALEYKEFGINDGWFVFTHYEGEDRVYEQAGILFEDGTVLYKGVTFQEYLKVRKDHPELVTPKAVKFDD